MTDDLPPLPSWIPDGIVSHESIRDYARLAIAAERERASRLALEVLAADERAAQWEDKARWAQAVSEAERARANERLAERDRLAKEVEELRGVAWLIERGQKQHQSPTCWWSGGDCWTADATNAVRFAFKADAEKAAAQFRPCSYEITQHCFVERARADESESREKTLNIAVTRLIADRDRLAAENAELRKVLLAFPGRSCGEATWNAWLFQKDAAMKEGK